MLRYSLSQRNKIGLLAAGTCTGSAIFLTSLSQDDKTCSLEQAPPAPTPTKSNIIPSRSSQMSRLTSTPEFDVIVIGGGATGSGTALDAAMRGLDVALIERGDFASETSSRSTKLIWAGIRYIATACAQLLRPQTLLSPIKSFESFKDEFQMVLNCHKERRIMLENNPHLTNWVPIAVPMTSWIAWPAPFGNPLFFCCPMVFPAVMKFYDSLCGFTCPPSHIMGKARAKRKFPQLDQDFKYVQVFYEGQHNDARTATCIALTAAEEGACVANYTEMIGIIRENEDAVDGNKGKAVGVLCRDKLTGEEFSVKAKSIIFAGGPFTDGLRHLEDPASKPAVNAAAGTHIVLPGYYCPDGIGLLDINTSDGRFLFFLPWQGSVLVGTTDRKGAPVSSPGPPEQEIQWILKEAEKYLSNDLQVRRADVLSSWQGWRPLASDPHAPPDAPISRDHVISTHPETDITFICGGKWTTYREMAEDVLDRVIDRKLELKAKAGPCQTEHRPLRGGVGYTSNVAIRLIQKYGVSEETGKHLATCYGMNAFAVCELAQPSGKRWPRFGKLLMEGYPYLECEVEYAAKNEMAVSVKDMLTTRTRLAFLNSEAALQAAPKVAELMGKALNWSKKEKKKQLDTAVEYLSQFGGPVPQGGAVEETIRTMTDVKSVFDVFDRDNNGYIDLHEMKTTAKEMGHVFASEEEAVTTFKKLDANGDGRISFEEFESWWHEASKEDKLRHKLGDKVGFTMEKLGDGPGSRGVAFG